MPPSNLTLKRMDAATNKIVEKVFESCLDLEDSVEYEKALKIAAEDGFLAGMKAALEIPVDVADLKTQEQIFFASGGVLRKNVLIRAAVKRLRKEMKSND